MLQESAFCGMLTQPKKLPLTEISTLVFFIVPMLVIAVQYTKMAVEISKTTKKTFCKGKGSVHRDSRKAQSNRSVIRMLSIVGLRIFYTYFWALLSKKY